MAAPRHLGIIPDGNRRWALERGLPAEAGYAQALEPGLRLLERARRAGIDEVSLFGFTRELLERPDEQWRELTRACVVFARRLGNLGVPIRAVGDDTSPGFPPELRAFVAPRFRGFNVNLLVNYSWDWDAGAADRHRTAAIPPMELIVRWGGRARLSGFLPRQADRASLYVVPELWPDYQDEQLQAALAWYSPLYKAKGPGPRGSNSAVRRPSSPIRTLAPAR